MIPRACTNQRHRYHSGDFVLGGGDARNQDTPKTILPGVRGADGVTQTKARAVLEGVLGLLTVADRQVSR